MSLSSGPLPDVEWLGRLECDAKKVCGPTETNCCPAVYTSSKKLIALGPNPASDYFSVNRVLTNVPFSVKAKLSIWAFMRQLVKEGVCTFFFKPPQQSPSLNQK